jgi:hypothetical protein
MRWLLDFSSRVCSGLSATEWKDLRWEVLVFAYHSDRADSVMPRVPLPTKQEILKMQGWLSALFSHLTTGSLVPIRISATTRLLCFKDGKLHGIVPHISLPWSDAFQLRVFEIATAGDVANRFRFCLECSRPYCAHKRQAYCSSSCSQKHRTREWRLKNRERFRSARRAAYKRKLEASLGGRIKVAARKK